MSDRPLPFHTREQLATALSVQRDVTEEQRVELAARAARIAVLEARIARHYDVDTINLRAGILSWLIREQQEIVYDFSETDSTTMHRAYEAIGDEQSRKVATWILGILLSDCIFSETALRAVMSQRCSMCSNRICSGDGCGDGSTDLQIPQSILRLIDAAKPRLRATSATRSAPVGAEEPLEVSRG